MYVREYFLLLKTWQNQNSNTFFFNGTYVKRQNAESLMMVE